MFHTNTSEYNRIIMEDDVMPKVLEFPRLSSYCFLVWLKFKARVSKNPLIYTTLFLTFFVGHKLAVHPHSWTKPSHIVGYIFW